MTTPASETSPKFHKLMDAAMGVSYHKYGALKDAYPHKVNAIASLKKRLKLYEETGNADYLVDIANFAMIEFMHPANENYHYTPTDGGEGRSWHSGGTSNSRKNNGDRQ